MIKVCHTLDINDDVFVANLNLPSKDKTGKCARDELFVETWAQRLGFVVEGSHVVDEHGYSRREDCTVLWTCITHKKWGESTQDFLPVVAGSASQAD
jgi:hypothetical protein